MSKINFSIIKYGGTENSRRREGFYGNWYDKLKPVHKVPFVVVKKGPSGRRTGINGLGVYVIVIRKR